jgi:hypothetical protein
VAILGEDVTMLPSASAVRKKLLAIRDEAKVLPTTDVNPEAFATHGTKLD